MNLRVDLIFESEQRSASLLNVKSLTRVLSITIPSILLILIAMFALDKMKITGELTELQEAWKDSEPKQKEALNISTELQNNLNTQTELEGWKESRLTWHDQILGIMQIVHVNIQLTSLTATEVVIVNEKTKIPTRYYKMIIQGETYANDAEEIVNQLQGKLQKSAPFNNYVIENGSTVIKYERKKDGRPNDRSFTIQCIYEPKEYK